MDTVVSFSTVAGIKMLRVFIRSALIYMVCTGSSGTPQVSALHEPLYRAEDHVSTIEAHATETQSGISAIRIEATVGELTACTNADNVVPSIIPCRTDAVAIEAECAFDDVKSEVSCSLPIDIVARRLVSYRVTAYSANKASAATPLVTYAGGAPLTYYKSINEEGHPVEVAWETARPIIWRTETPGSHDDRGGKFDWGFMPDEDLSSYREFTNDLQPLLLTLFYRDQQTFTSWAQSHRDFFNLWAGPNGADAEGCSREFDAQSAKVHGVMDGTSILHRKPFVDCASITMGSGAGTTQTDQVGSSTWHRRDATWVLQHEAGHFLFGLGDEYSGGGHDSVSDPPNVFPDEMQCLEALNSLSSEVPNASCAEIAGYGFWRIDDRHDATMKDRKISSDWRTLSGRALANHIANCQAGNCY